MGGAVKIKDIQTSADTFLVNLSVVDHGTLPSCSIWSSVWLSWRRCSPPVSRPTSRWGSHKSSDPSSWWSCNQTFQLATTSSTRKQFEETDVRLRALTWELQCCSFRLPSGPCNLLHVSERHGSFFWRTSDSSHRRRLKEQTVRETSSTNPEDKKNPWILTAKLPNKP